MQKYAHFSNFFVQCLTKHLCRSILFRNLQVILMVVLSLSFNCDTLCLVWSRNICIKFVSFLATNAKTRCAESPSFLQCIFSVRCSWHRLSCKRTSYKKITFWKQAPDPQIIQSIPCRPKNNVAISVSSFYCTIAMVCSTRVLHRDIPQWERAHQRLQQDLIASPTFDLACATVYQCCKLYARDCLFKRLSFGESKCV